MIDSWPDAETAYTRALENWRAAGDPRGEGDTLRRMSGVLWRLCRGDEILAVAEAAVAILEPLGPTAELAAAYGNLAAHQNAPGRLDIVVPLAHRAQELAVRFGVPAVQSRAATTEAQAVWFAGGDWEPVLRRALSIALKNGISTKRLRDTTCTNCTTATGTTPRPTHTSTTASPIARTTISAPTTTARAAYGRQPWSGSGAGRIGADSRGRPCHRRLAGESHDPDDEPGHGRGAPRRARCVAAPGCRDDRRGRIGWVYVHRRRPAGPGRGPLARGRPDRCAAGSRTRGRRVR